MTDLQELIDAVQAKGASITPDGDDLVVRPAGCLPPDLKERLRARKPELLETLRLRESCERLEAMNVAIRIVPRDGQGKGWWLASSSVLHLANDGAPVYEVREWETILASGLSNEEIRQLDRDIQPWKKEFGATVELRREGSP